VYDLPALLGPLRTASEPALARAVSVRSVERWVATGRLVRLHPGWVTLPEWVDDWTVRAHAATGYTGGTLSHTSALAVHGLVDRPAVVDVTVPAVHRLRSTRSLRIHRTPRPHAVVPAGGLPATPLPRSLVDAWGDAHRGQSRRSSVDRARNALFRACRERRLGVPSVAAELAAVPRLPGAARLRELLGALATGYESALEMLGVRALRDAGLPPPLLQHVLRLPQGSARLDAAWPEILLAVEFDGQPSMPIGRRGSEI
jgi:hypothetical protein